MAFCTSCGAQVNGAFCNQCGTPVGQQAAAAPPPPPPLPAAATPMPGAYAQPAYGQPVPMPPVQARKTSPIVWILVGIFAFIVICGIIAVSALGMFVHHVARNPAAAIARMAALANKDVEVVNENEGNGTITLRDKHTGKIVTMSFDDAKNGKFSFSAQDDNGKTATMEFGGGPAKFPSWVPKYPGSEAMGTFSVKGTDNNGSGQGGNFTYSTSDSPSKVLQFYQDKAKDLGLKVNLTTTTGEGGMIVATEEPENRSLTVIVGEDSGKTTVNVTYGEKR